MSLRKLLLFFIIVLVLVTPVSADRIINTEQVERSSSCTVLLDEMGDVERIYIDDIFPELVLPENILDGEKARVHLAHLSEINIWVAMIIDIEGNHIDKSVSIGVFLPGERVSKTFDSLKSGETQSIYPKLDFVAPLEAVGLDYYVVGPFSDDIDYSLYVTFNIEYYWEFSWIVSLKSESIAPTTGRLNPEVIAIFGVGGVFALFVVGIVGWDNRRNRRVKEKT